MNRALTVLGMHRSGTSMLIGTLREAGVYLGKVHDQAFEHNRKGLLEPRAVLFMQEDLLKANGGSWSDPPGQVAWQPLHLAVRDLFIESRSEQAIWAFKDPRTLFTLEGWQKALPRLELAGIFRHPFEVAQSMQLRNSLSLEAGMAVWKKYNERLLALHRRAAFPVIEFHADPEVLRAKLGQLIGGLRLPHQPEPSEFVFFEEGIRRHEVDEAKLPADVEEVYRHLQAIAL